MAKSVEMVETLANVDQYSPLVVTFIVADTIASFFLSFFSPQFQHIRFGETRPFAAARVSLSLSLSFSFLLLLPLVVNARVSGQLSFGWTHRNTEERGALSRRDSSSSWTLVSRKALRRLE